jgi:hypothetical protein
MVTTARFVCDFEMPMKLCSEQAHAKTYVRASLRSERA